MAVTASGRYFSVMPEITHLLDAAAAGDRRAAADLLPLVYDELRQLAAARMAAEPVSHTLQPTALVHEAYLRLLGSADTAKWANQAHFFAAAAESMRRILVDAARRKRRLRHGGGRNRLPMPDEILTPERESDLLAVDDVVDALASHNPVAANLVKLHVFAGLTLEQAAAAAGVSARTGYRHWAYARAWMFRRLEGESPRPDGDVGGK